MATIIEKTGKTVEEALQAAISELGVEEKDVEMEVLEKPSKGILGFFGNKPARIKVTLKEVPKATGQIARYGMEHINGLIGATAAIKALCADDKENAAIQEGTAFAGMFVWCHTSYHTAMCPSYLCCM